MWQEPTEPFLHGGLGLLPLATLCSMPKGKSLPAALRDVVREIDQRLSTEAEHARAVRLMTASFILTGMRVETETLATIYDGVRVMHESTAYDYWVEEGERRTARRFLLRIGKQHLGPADATTESDLQAVDDLERLERMADAILTAKSWQELLAVQ